MSSPERYQPVAQPPAPRTAVSQATAIEQSRAVAEVQAAVVVAQNMPRDMQRAEAEMRDVCGRLSMANHAFYDVPNRGTGPTVHLMRELARIWGNIQYGVHELSRDDEAGHSEIQAFAWDVQTNTRSTRTFIAPHARMANKQRRKLTDLGDIYLSNQNVGARAVRECISTVLPRYFTEEAQDLCRATLEKGEGKPLSERVSDMVSAFAKIGIKVEQLEQKLGLGKGSWTAANVADMAITFVSITRDGLDKNEVFPPARVTADEVKAASNPGAKPESTQVKAPTIRERLVAALVREGKADEAEQFGYLSGEFKKNISSLDDLTDAEALEMTTFLETEQAKSATAEGDSQ